MRRGLNAAQRHRNRVVPKSACEKGVCTRICFRACIFQDVGHCHGGYRFGARQILRTPPHPMYGNSVRAYGAERTLCDMLRSTLSPDLQLL